MWLEFTEKTQIGLIDMVLRSAREDRLDVTIPRICALAGRLSQPETPSELEIRRLTSIFRRSVIKERPEDAPAPLAFLVEYVPPEIALTIIQ